MNVTQIQTILEYGCRCIISYRYNFLVLERTRYYLLKYVLSRFSTLQNSSQQKDTYVEQHIILQLQYADQHTVSKQLLHSKQNLGYIIHFPHKKGKKAKNCEAMRWR